MATKPLSLIDQLFLLLETAASPKHVASLMLFEKPTKARRNFVEELYLHTLEFDEAGLPFGLKPTFSPRSLMAWKTDHGFEAENHIFYHKLPARSTREHALNLAGDLHSTLLEREQPLWEMHFIDGLPNKGFALYTRLHHAYGDGVTMTRWLREALTEKPSDDFPDPFFTYDFSGTKTPSRGGDLLKILKSLMGTATLPVRTVAGIQKIFAQLWLEQLRLTKNNIAVPFTSKHTPLTGQVSEGRQVACTQVSMEQISAIRKEVDSTVNHVVLTAIDGALRRYLDDLNIELDQPLSIQMPVNLRKPDDTSSGNKIGIVLVDLAHESEDVAVRHEEIGHALQKVRHQIETTPDVSIQAYGILTAVVSQTAELLKIGNLIPPLGNTLVSNVPGPKNTLYLGPAKMTEYYPISALPPSLLMNITLFSYAGQMNFGLVSTKGEELKLHKLAQYIRESFDELESTFIKSTTKPKAKRPSKAKAKAKSKAKPKAKPASKAKAKSKPKAKPKSRPKPKAKPKSRPKP